MNSSRRSFLGTSLALPALASVPSETGSPAQAPAAQGLPVADVLRFLMYAESYGQFALGREQFKALPAEIAAVRCSSCANCTVECPNGVQVAARLHQAQQLFG